MKKLLFAIASCCVLSACSKKDDTNTTTNPPATTDSSSYALWVQVGSWPNANYYVLGLTDLDSANLTLAGNGVEVTSVLNNSVISHGGYYYYYNTTEGRFGKYQIENGAVKTVKEVPFTNLASLGGHTWVDDNTLVMIGTASGAKSVNYSVVDVSTMTITNGTFAGLPSIPENYINYRVGGDIQYVNGNLFFALTFVNGDYIAYGGISEIQVKYPAMTVGDVSTDSHTSGVGNTSGYFATSFVDKNKDMYFISSWSTKWAGGTGNSPIYIHRIKSGTTKLDDSYHVKVSDIVGKEAGSGLFMDLGNGTAILKYIVSTTDNVSTYNYTIINLASGTEVRKLTEIPNGAGSERNVLVKNGKAYIAVLSGQAKDYIWIYDAATDKVSQGTSISGGYVSFSRLDELK